MAKERIKDGLTIDTDDVSSVEIRDPDRQNAQWTVRYLLTGNERFWDIKCATQPEADRIYKRLGGK